MADHATPKDIEENVRQITDSSWKSALRAAMRVLEEPRYLKAERLAAVRRGIEETVEKFGDQHPRQKDKMIAWGKLQIQLIEDFVAESKLAELRVGTTRLSPLVGKATGNVASEDDLRLEVENVSLRRLLAQAGIHAAEQKVAERLQRVQHRHPTTAVRCALRVTLIRD
jgi:hypothetical protein